MNEELFLAILAMDSYNRGYDTLIDLRDIDSDGTPIDNSDTIDIRIGDAQILRDSSILLSEKGDRLDISIGFYAAVYEYKTEIVISYRGTDNLNISLSNVVPDDIEHGWTLGTGNTSSEQGRMAVSLYKAVADEFASSGSSNNYFDPNISTTGHSLGGGLAGYVAALYGKEAQLFDSMAFQRSAEKTANFRVELEGEGGVRESVEIKPSQVATYVQPEGMTIVSIESIASDTLLNLVYEGGIPQDIDLDRVSGFSIAGEALSFNRLFQDPATRPDPLDLGDNVDIFPLGSSLIAEAIARHSVATLIIRLFAETEVESDAWRASAKFYWPVLYDDQFAESIGMLNVPGALSEDGEYSDILRRIIAYSAIDEGERVFGDSGIRAFYNDAIDLGSSIGRIDASTVISDHADDISKVIVQFAGQLALAKLELGQGLSGPGNILEDATDGVVRIDETDGLLTVELADNIWNSIASGVSPQSHFVNSILLSSGIESEIREWMGLLWDDESLSAFDRVSFALEGKSAILTPSVPLSDKASILIGSELSDTLQGGTGDDLILGSSGDDTFIGNPGDDIIVGSPGNDVVDYSENGTGLFVNLDFFGNGFVAEGLGFVDAILSIEEIIGTEFDDVFEFDTPNGLLIEPLGGFDTFEYRTPVVIDEIDDVVWDHNGRNYDTLPEDSVIYGGVVRLPDHNQNQDLTLTGGMLDYSKSDVAAYFNFNFNVSPTVTFANGIVHNVRKISVHGTNHGDVFDLWRASTIITGTGNDTVNMFEGFTGAQTDIVYTGGDDTYHLSGNIEQITLATTVSFEDVTIESFTFNSVTNEQRMVMDIAGHGSIAWTKSINDLGFNIVLRSGSDFHIESPFTAPPDGLEFTVFGSNQIVAAHEGTWGDDVWTGRPDLAESFLAKGGDDTLYGLDESDLFGRTGDFLYGGGGNDLAYGGGGREFLYGDIGDDTLYGEGGRDWIYGGDGNDTLIGGVGDDQLWGGPGDDLFIFGAGDGSDSIRDNSGFDTLLVVGDFSPESLSFRQSGLDLFIEINSGVQIHDFFLNDGDRVLENIVFEDGTNFDVSTYDFNRSPIVEDDHFVSQEDRVFYGDVLVNDYDPDGDRIEASITDTELFFSDEGGRVFIDGDGLFEYTPANNFVGVDTFLYNVFDGRGGSGFARVFITVTNENDNPTPLPDFFEFDEDTSLSSNVLMDNGSGVDTDIDGDVLSVMSGVFASASGASVDIREDGSFEYVPLENFNGPDSFEYTLLDGQGGLETGAVTVEVRPVNDDPVAVNDLGAFFLTDEDTAFTTVNVLGNDTDPDVGDTLSVISVDTAGTLGTVVENGDGTFEYNPSGQFESLVEGESATDSFGYTVSDGSGGTDAATVTITIEGVEDAPELNTVMGTEGRDILIGSEEDDLILSLGGALDMLMGGGGADVFQIGDEANNGLREFDIIQDFEVGVDQIQLMDGVSVANTFGSGTTQFVFLAGDFDTVILSGVSEVTDQIFA